MGFDFRTDHIGKTQDRNLVRTPKLTYFDYYFSLNCTPFYVFCTINKNNFHILYVPSFCVERNRKNNEKEFRRPRHLANREHDKGSFGTFPYGREIEFAYATGPMTLDVMIL